MKVLSIGFDRKIFEAGSAVRARMIEYAALFDELHMVVFARKSEIPACARRAGRRNPKSETPIPAHRHTRDGTGQANYNNKIQISKNCWVYPTNSFSKWFYVFDAIRIGKKIIENCKLPARAPSPKALAACDRSRFGAGGKIENSRNDFVVSGQDPFECGLAAWLIAKKFNLPLHVQIHTDFLSPYFSTLSFLNRVRVFLAKNILPRARAIRVVSRRIAASLEASNLKLKATPVVLPVFSGLKRLAEKPPSFSLKEKYSDWDFIILMVARLSPEKNIGFALELLSELVKKYPKTGMVVVGEGPLQRSLKFKVKKLKLEEMVVFEGWQRDLVSHYKTADLFLQTSLFEGFGLSLLEAAASGSPAISSDVGIAPEFLALGGRSFVCSVNDRNCFLRKISELIEHGELRAAFGKELANRATAKFSKTKEDYLAAYKESIEQSVR